MSRQKINILSDASNSVIARHVERQYPGILIQGDTFRGLLDDLDELQEGLREKDLGSVKEISDGLRERFVELLIHYEKTLEENNISLPYPDSQKLNKDANQ